MVSLDVNSELSEIFKALRSLFDDLLVVIVIGQTRLHASFDHLEVSFLERLWDVSFSIDLFHFLVDDSRLEKT